MLLFADFFAQNAQNGTYKAIGDTFRRYPNETLLPNIRAGIERAAMGTYGFLEVRNTCGYTSRPC